MSATFYDIINGLIDHTDSNIFIYESDGRGEHEVFICEWMDEYYKEHKEELYKRKFYFMGIHKDRIEIYVRPEN